MAAPRENELDLQVLAVARSPSKRGRRGRKWWGEMFVSSLWNIVIMFMWLTLHVFTRYTSM